MNSVQTMTSVDEKYCNPSETVPVSHRASRQFIIRTDDHSPTCGAWIDEEGAGLWCVWAPLAQFVELVLESDDGSTRSVQMRPEKSGYYRHREPSISVGQKYSYRLDHGPLRPDPASRWQPEGVGHPSAMWCPNQFYWTDGDWNGIDRKQLVIYELHVGTFTLEGTFDAIVPRLHQLRDLGVTAIEIMPVAQFPGTRNWGYDGVHAFAVQSSYGGPDGLQRLVNAAHATGIAVLLDVVYNHFGPEGNYLAEFGPYFTDRYQTPWGKAVNYDDQGCEGVREFVLQNVRMWIRDFHLDGLRLDAAHAIFDRSPRHILSDIQRAADDESKHLHRPVHIIAESADINGRLTRSARFGGYGLTAQWNDEFHHSVHSLLTGEQNGYYADYGDAEDLVEALNQRIEERTPTVHRKRRNPRQQFCKQAGDRFVVCIQNHDQIGNRARGDRFGTLLRPEQQRLAAGLMLLSPYIPLIFMGDEYGEVNPFPYFCSFNDPGLIQAVTNGRRAEFSEIMGSNEIPDPQSEQTFKSAHLNWPNGSQKCGLMLLYQDLLYARRNWPELMSFRNTSASLLTTRDGNAVRVLRMTRECATKQGLNCLDCYFNLTEVPQSFQRDEICGTKLLISSAWGRYIAADEPHLINEPSSILAPYEFRVFGHDSRRLP